MNELDDGRVVFFCGAGVSTGPGSELPSFGCLVEHVYADNHLGPDSVEKEALRSKEYDRALGLLERPGRLGVYRVRRSVIKHLSTPPTSKLATHEALITLSTAVQGVRLVTTNFDNRFVEAGLDDKCIDVAPKLPPPKPHNWSSLVHVHGRILQDDTDDGSNLVLTAADFGRAYLSERWAARFVSELFREFTVVFVGYSLKDRVMGYLVDAIAAERARGARYERAYAFAANCEASNRADVEAGWQVKNVEPILYDKCDGHRLLSETLVEWARIKADPHARTRIVLDGMSKLPDGSGAERVSWAVQAPSTAEALAESTPTTNETDFPKIAAWLDQFDRACLFSRPAQPTDAVPVRLVYRTQNPLEVDAVTRQLARWIARHLHVPQVLAWVLHKGGCLHPVLREIVRLRLAHPAESIPPKLRHLWTVLSSEATGDRRRFKFALQHFTAASDDERRRISDLAIASIAPRLVARPGADWQKSMQQESLLPIDSCGHLELLVGDKDECPLIEPILRDRHVLARHAATLTGYLERALSLLAEADIATLSLDYRRSIADHEQNRYCADWGHLVDLVRDSYLVVAGKSKSRARARNLLDRWMLSAEPLFKRLALHVLTDEPQPHIQAVRRLLLAGPGPGLWDLEMRREVLRFLRLAGSRLPQRLLTEIVRAIHGGPTLPGDYSNRPSEKAIRFHHLAHSGAPVDEESKALANQWQPSEEPGLYDRDEFVAWTGARWVGPEEFAPRDLVGAEVAAIVQALDGKQIEPRQFMGLALRQPGEASGALRELAKRNEWPTEHWEYFFASLVELRRREQLTSALRDQVCTLLIDAPDSLFAGVDSAAAGFVEGLAKEYAVDQEQRFGQLWKRAWTGVAADEVTAKPLDHALNSLAGRLAQAALERLWKCQPRVGEGLPANVRPYFDKVAIDRNGRHGRVVFATHLYSLFMIDRDWTQRNIISRLGPSEPSERYALWSGYAVSARIGPNLQTAFEEPFIEMLKRYDQVHDPYNVLIKLLVMICIDSPSPIEPTHVHQVIATLSDDALEGVLEHFVSRLIGDNNERAQIWCKDVQPWLEEYWPREGARNSALTAHTMLKLIMQCGSAFPDAVRWALETEVVQSSTELLRLHRLIEGDCDHITQYPDYALQLIAGVTANMESFSHDNSSILHRILDSLKNAKPELATRTEFQSLVRRVSHLIKTISLDELHAQ